MVHDFTVLLLAAKIENVHAISHDLDPGQVLSKEEDCIALCVRPHGLRLLVSPDTILRWHRDIVGRRWAARSIRGKTGRPATRRDIRALVYRLARENPGWGYRGIHGELAGLGVRVSASTVWEILKKAGIDPAPRRTGPTWSLFLRSQAEAILACDFFTADLLDGTQAYVLAVIEHASRRIRILGVTLHPTGDWTTQQARNLLMNIEGRADGLKFLIRDRDTKFTAEFDAVFTAIGMRIIKTPVQAPRANAIAERWIASARRECLDRMLITGERQLRLVLSEYIDHNNSHRPHRTLHQNPPDPRARPPAETTGVRVLRRDRLGGLIHEYAQVA